MKRFLDIYWPFIGILLFIPTYFGILEVPEINLEVISILFGGLLAVMLMLPTIENFRQIQKIKQTGHISDLVYFIRFPLTLSILFIIIEFFSESLTFTLSPLCLIISKSIYMGLWGIFFLSLIRIMIIVPHLLYDKSRKRDVE